MIFFSKNDPSVVQSTDFVNDWPTSAYTVVCTGGELDLALCNITLLANSSCSSGSYVGIRCRMYSFLQVCTFHVILFFV